MTEPVNYFDQKTLEIGIQMVLNTTQNKSSHKLFDLILKGPNYNIYTYMHHTVEHITQDKHSYSE